MLDKFNQVIDYLWMGFFRVIVACGPDDYKKKMKDLGWPQ
jgi:hypothetical protein